MTFLGLIFFVRSRLKHVLELNKLNKINLENKSREIELGAQKQISTLVKQLAHEINNPLTISLAQIRILKSKMNSDEFSKYFDKLEASQQRINLVAEELQSLTSKREVTPLTTGDPTSEILNSFNKIKNKFTNENININIHKTSCKPIVEYIPTVIESIIRSIVTNAIEKKRF